MKFESELEIDRSPEAVFAYLADPTNLPEWQHEVSEVRGAPGEPLLVGATFTEVRTVLGRRMESTLEVTASQPGREFSLRARSGPVKFQVRHLLKPAGEGRTRLRVVGEADPGRMFRLAGGILARAAERRSAGDFARLKERLEERS